MITPVTTMSNNSTSKDLNDDDAGNDDGGAKPGATGNLFLQKKVAEEHSKQRERAEYRCNHRSFSCLKRGEIKKERSGSSAPGQYRKLDLAARKIQRFHAPRKQDIRRYNKKGGRRGKAHSYVRIIQNRDCFLR